MKSLHEYIQESIFDIEKSSSKNVDKVLIIKAFNNIFNDILNSNSFKEYNKNVLNLKDLLDNIGSRCQSFPDAYTSKPRFKKDKSYIIIGNLDQSNLDKGLSYKLIDGSESDTKYSWILIGSSDWNHKYPISIAAYSNDEDTRNSNMIHASVLGGYAHDLKRHIQHSAVKYDDMNVFVYELEQGNQIYKAVESMIGDGSRYSKKITK
jgi:hypothetical protein